MRPAAAGAELEARRFDTARATVYELPWPVDGDTQAVYVRHHVEDEDAGDYDVGEAAEATLDALERVAWRSETVDIMNTLAWPLTASEGDDSAPAEGAAAVPGGAD
jgi:hypothetical protein